MKKIQTLFLQDLYSKHLSTINGIHFTKREIDVISCLLSARRTNKIAYFLSVYPRTVETHIRNIMFKLECNTRERIIDFIEASDKRLILRKYYSLLQINVIFEKSLQDIAKVCRKKAPQCFLMYGNVKDAFVSHLESHLTLAGITVSTKAREEENKDCLVFAMPDLWGGNEAVAFLQKLRKTSGKILLLLRETRLHKDVPKEINNFDIVNFAEQKNYYFSFFVVLKKILSEVNLDDVVNDFKNKYKKINIEPDFNSVSLNSSKTRKQFFYPKRNSLFFLFLAIGLIAGCFLFIRVTSERQKEEILLQSNLSIPNESTLLHRPELLTQIDSKFEGQEGIQTVALIGVGGSGKTTLARQYAYHQQATIVWEINAETKGSLKGSFENLAQNLSNTAEDKKWLTEINEIKNPKEKENKIIEFVRKKLKIYSNWLLIFDNVEKFMNILEYFPQNPQTWGKGRIILTTQDSNIHNNTYVNHTLKVEELSQDQKLNLFLKIMNHDHICSSLFSQKEKIKEFLNEIPPFPLDISLAAYYLKTTNISYPKYIEKLNEHNKDFTNFQENILKEVGSYNKTRYGIITLSVQHLIREHPNFENLLLFISVLDSQNIPRDLLNKFTNDVIGDNFIYQLRKHSLITSEFSSPMGLVFSIHRSTQDIILAYFIHKYNIKDIQQFLEPFMHILQNYTAEMIEKEYHIKMKYFVSHYKRLLRNENVLTNTERVTVLGNLGCFYFYLGDYIKAKQLLEKTLEVPYKEKYINEAFVLFYLGIVYKELSDYERAKVSLEKCLTIYSKHLPNSHAKLARVFAHLGHVERSLGNYEKSRILIQKSLSIYNRFLPHNYGGIAQTLAYLGNVERELGNYAEARNYLHQALSIYEHYLPDNYIGIARTLGYLGITYRELSKYEMAETYLLQSLKVYKEHLSENHPRVVWLFIHLGILYRELGNYKAAIEHLNKSLIIYKKHLPGDNIGFARVFAYLGNVKREVGKYKEAEQLLHQSLSIYKKSFSNHHSENQIEYGRVLGYLGIVYKEMGHYEKAKEFLQRSLTIYEKHFSPHHIRVIWILVYLGNVNRILGDYTKARELLEYSLRIYKEHLSGQHARIAWVSTHLANLEREVGNYEKAKSLLEQTLSIYKQCSPPNQTGVGWVLAHLGSTYIGLGNYELAKSLLSQSLTIYTKELPENQRKIAWVTAHLADVYKKLGDYEKSQNLLESALKNYEMYYDQNSIEIARILRNMGSTYFVKGDMKTANYFLHKALNIFQKNKHPERYMCLENLSDLYLKKSISKKNDKKQCQFYREKAVGYIKEALEIVRSSLPEKSSHSLRIQAKFEELKQGENLEERLY